MNAFRISLELTSNDARQYLSIKYGINKRIQKRQAKYFLPAEYMFTSFTLHLSATGVAFNRDFAARTPFYGFIQRNLKKNMVVDYSYEKYK